MNYIGTYKVLKHLATGSTCCVYLAINDCPQTDDYEG